MTEKRARIPLSKVRTPAFEKEYPPRSPNHDRTRFKTADDVVFDVFDASVVPSTFMNKCIHNRQTPTSRSPPPTEPFSIPNVNADVFDTVLKYCYFHTSRKSENIPEIDVKDWDDKFMELDPRQLCELASAAYYLDVKDLIDLTCRAIAAIISGKTAEQIRKTFHIENDLEHTIDRMLPQKISRRRGREGSPRKGRREILHPDPIPLTEPQHPQLDPAPQKSVEELSDWINTTTSSKKKKKKKRHKDKHVQKKNDSDEQDPYTPTTTSPSVSNPLNDRFSHPPSPEYHHPSPEPFPDEIQPNHPPPSPIPSSSIPSSSIPSSSIPSSSIPSSSTPRGTPNGHVTNVTSHISATQPDPPSDDDIIIVSEKIVSARKPVMSINGAHRQTADANRTRSASNEKRKNTTPRPARLSNPSTPRQSQNPVEAGATARRRHSIPLPRTEESAKKEEHHVAAPPRPVQRSPQTPIAAFHQNGHANHAKLDGSPVQADRVHSGSSSQPSRGARTPRSLRNEASVETANERYINLPPDMDREVEAFQARLAVSEPPPILPPSRASPEVEIVEAIYGQTSHSNGVHPRRHSSAVSPGSSIASSAQRATRSAKETEEEGMSPQYTNDERASTPKSIPQTVVLELARLEKRQRTAEKRAEEIDKKVSELTAEREQVRDQLAHIKIRLYQKREQYGLEDFDL